MKDYTQYAIWALVAYSVFLTIVVWSVQKGLWMAVEANQQNVQQVREIKLPCSSDVNPDCAVYIK